MKVKYLLVVVCMLVSLAADAQGRRKSTYEPEPKRAKSADTTITRDSLADHVADDVIPENNDLICSALVTLMNDAANDFEHTKGKSIETVAAGTRYTSMGGIPGSITSSLLRGSARWQYEGIVYQGNSKDDMKEAYEKYKGIFNSCLTSKGFSMATGKGSNGKSEGYPEAKFTNESATPKDAKHNPRATISVDYTAGADLYVVTVNVWSN